MRFTIEIPCALFALSLIACTTESEREPARSGAGNAATARPENGAASAALPPPRALEFPDYEGWTRQPPENPMRLAQYVLPAAEGDDQDATLVITHFPGGGSFEANVERWAGQFSQPDGSSSAERAQLSQATVAGRAARMVELSGTYVAPPMPGVGAAPMNEADWMMISVQLDGTQGAWFFRLLGPRATVEKWRTDFRRYLGEVSEAE